MEDFSCSHQFNRPDFASQPTLQDYHTLAQHVTAASQDTLHSALWPQRTLVAERLWQMGEQPEKEAHRAAYQVLRLLVW